MHAFEGRAREDDDIDDRRAQEYQQPFPRLGHIKVEDRQMRHTLAGRRAAHLSTPSQAANRNQDQPDYEDRRQYQIRQNPEVRAALVAELLDQKQAYDKNQTCDR